MTDRTTASDPLPPLPTDLDAWHTTVRLHRIPDYLRASADDLERRMNGERPTPDPRSLADLFADLNDPSPEQLRARVARLRSESSRLAALATEIEERLDGT